MGQLQEQEKNMWQSTTTKTQKSPRKGMHRKGYAEYLKGHQHWENEGEVESHWNKREEKEAKKESNLKGDRKRSEEKEKAA